MATVVLGGLGAGLGAIFGPAGSLAGIQLGFAIGASIGGIVDAAMTRIPSPAGDMRVSGSNYGTPIAISYGATRIAGNTVWVAKDSNGNHLIPHWHGTFGGKGITPATETFSASWATMICEGSHIGTDGSVQRQVLTRIWADDKILWQTGDSNNSNIRFYNGSPTQTVDSLIASVEGSWTAYRNRCYVVFENIDLTPFSNRIPNMSFEMAFDSAFESVAILDIVKDIAARVGVTENVLFAEGTTAPVIGFLINQLGTAQAWINMLTTAYNHDLIEVDGELVCLRRGGDTVLDVAFGDLGAQLSGSGDPPARLTEARTQDIELPGVISLTYFTSTSGRFFEQVTQYNRRDSANVQNVINLSFPFTLDDTLAKQIMATQLDLAWLERWNYKLSLPPSYMKLAPGDLFNIPVGLDHLLQRVRCTSMEIGLFGELRIECVPDDPSVYVQTINGGHPPSVSFPSLGSPLSAVFAAWSYPSVLQTADGNQPGFYVAATGPYGWETGEIYYSTNGGTSWIDAGAVPGRSIMGQTASPALADGSTADAWDMTNSVPVALYEDGQLGSVSQNAVLSGANVGVIGAEICGFATATPTSAQHYTLSTLYRGINGSSMIGHTVGELFVQAATTIKRISVPKAYIDTTIEVVVVSRGQMITDVTPVSVVIAQNIYPYLRREEILSVGTHVLTPAPGAPSSSVGNPGDTYINSTTRDVYYRTTPAPASWGPPIGSLSPTSSLFNPTSVGQIQYCVDGSNWSAQTPVVADDTGEILTTSDNGYIMVAGAGP